MRTSDSRKRAESDDLDDLSRDALVARLRAAEVEVEELRAEVLRLSALASRYRDERQDAVIARVAVAAELAALRGEVAGLARRAVQGCRDGRHTVALVSASSLYALLDETRGESDE